MLTAGTCKAFFFFKDVSGDVMFYCRRLCFAGSTEPGTALERHGTRAYRGHCDPVWSPAETHRFNSRYLGAAGSGFLSASNDLRKTSVSRVERDQTGLERVINVALARK